MITQQAFSKRSIRTRDGALPAVAATVMFCAAFFGAADAMAAEIKLLASANPALMNAITGLIPEFQRSTGHKVTADFAPAVPLKRRIDAGEAFDLVIFPGVDALIRQGKVVADTRVAFARTGFGIGVRKGAPKPDVSSVEAFKRALLDAKSVGNNAQSETGVQIAAILDSLGIAQDVRPKLKDYPNSTQMGAALARGEVDIVVSSATSLLEPGSMDVVGFPSELQKYIVHVAGVSATAKEPEAAKALLGFLMSPTATAVLKAKGFERD